MTNTFMQAIYEGAAKAAESESGREELKGLSKEQFLASVRKVTNALDELPKDTSLHVVLLAVTYMRNAIITAMQVNQQRLEKETGGSA